MATDTDLVASKAAALRLAKRMGCTGAHQHPDGKWMPCATMEEYEKLKKTQPDSEKKGIEIIESRRRYRNSKGKNKRKGWEKLGERGLTSIDTISGGGLVGGRGGSIKAAQGWAPDDEDPDVFDNARSARRRARQLGCIGVARRTSRAGKTVWTPCSNMTDYAKRTGSTAFGRNFQRRRARRTLERAVAREVRRQLRRKKSLMEALYEDKALGQKLRRARIATTTPFNPDARDADMDMLVQEGTPWERPARPRIPQIGTRRAGRRRAERGADRRERRRDLSQPQRRRPRQEARQTTVDESDGFASQRYEFSKRFPGFASERHESVEELRKEILDRVSEEHRNKDHREVHLVFGPPGAGKTARVDDGTLHVPGKGEAAHTDPDIYKRFDPAWNDGEGADVAHGRSRHESRKTIQEAEKLGMDVVVQGTGKDGQLISDLVYVDGDFEKGRQGNVTSIMHFIWSSDRDRRIFDRGVGRGPDDQRRRFGTDPRDAAEIRNRITKYIEEGRLDEFYIYDNDVGPDESPPVIASFLDGVLAIHDDDKFDEIFTETDADGNPVTITEGGSISPGAYADSDDPRIGKTHAQRIRDFGEDPEAYKKYDEKKRKDIAEGTRKPERGGYGLRGNLTEEEARIAEGLGYNQEWRDRMRARSRGADPDAEEGYPSQRSLGDEYRTAQRAQGWASQRGESFEEKYGSKPPSGEGDCFLASVKAGRELEEAGVDNHGNPISNVRVVHGAPLGEGGDAEGRRYAHSWIEYDVEAPEPVFHMDLVDPETQRQILERIPDDMRPQFIELIDASLEMERQIKAGESGLFDTLGIPRPGKRTMVRDYSNIRRKGDTETTRYWELDPAELHAERPDFDKEWYYNKGSITDEDVLGEFSLDEMETLQEEFGIQEFGRDEADDLLGMLEDQDPEAVEIAEARRRFVQRSNQRVRRESGYASSREELKSEDGPLAKMFPDSTERERGYLAYQLLADGVGGEDDRVPQKLWDTFVRLVEEEHPGVVERLDAVSRTLETLDGYERLTQSGLVSAPGIVNGVDPGQIGEPVTLYHAGYVDLRQADGTFAGKARQQFGPGVYTASEAFPVIYGWARPKRGSDGIQTGQPGYLHTTKWTGDGSPRILDMEEPLPDDLLDLAERHLTDLRRFMEAADPVKERPSTPDEIDAHDDPNVFTSPTDWTADIARRAFHEEMIEGINETIERIRRSREQGRPQRTGREILGPNDGLSDIFKAIEINPDGIIDMSGNPDGWAKSTIVDRMRTKLNNDLMEAGYDVLRAKDVMREEFMFLDPSKVEFVDSAKISSMDPFGNTGGHHLRQILYDEGGYASARGPNSAGRGRPQYDEEGGTIPRIFDADADYTYEDLEGWTMLELHDAARSLGVPFTNKPKKDLVRDILDRRTDRRRPVSRGPTGGRNPLDKPSREQQLGMLRNQYRNAETIGDQDEMDRLTDEMKELGSRPTKRRGYSSERERPTIEMRPERSNIPGFTGEKRYYPTIDIGNDLHLSEQMSLVDNRYIINVRSSNGIQTFYKRTGEGGKAAGEDANRGNWTPMHGLGSFEMGGNPGWFRKPIHGNRYGDEEAAAAALNRPRLNKEIGQALDEYFKDFDFESLRVSGLAAVRVGETSFNLTDWRWEPRQSPLPTIDPDDPGLQSMFEDHLQETLQRNYDFNRAHGLPVTREDYREEQKGVSNLVNVESQRLFKERDARRTAYDAALANDEPHEEALRHLNDHEAEVWGGWFTAKNPDEQEEWRQYLRENAEEPETGYASERKPPVGREGAPSFSRDELPNDIVKGLDEQEWDLVHWETHPRFGPRESASGETVAFSFNEDDFEVVAYGPLGGGFRGPTHVQWRLTQPDYEPKAIRVVKLRAKSDGPGWKKGDYISVQVGDPDALRWMGQPVPDQIRSAHRIGDGKGSDPQSIMAPWSYIWSQEKDPLLDSNWPAYRDRHGVSEEAWIADHEAQKWTFTQDVVDREFPKAQEYMEGSDWRPGPFEVREIKDPEGVTAVRGDPAEIMKNLRESMRAESAGDADMSLADLQWMTEDLLGDMDNPDDPWDMEAEGGVLPGWADAKTPPPEPPRVVQGYRDRLADLKEIFDSWETPNQAALAMIDHLTAVLDDHDRRYKERGPVR